MSGMGQPKQRWFVKYFVGGEPVWCNVPEEEEPTPIILTAKDTHLNESDQSPNPSNDSSTLAQSTSSSKTSRIYGCSTPLDK